MLDELQECFDRAATAGDARVGAHKNDTADLVSSFRAETRRVLDEFSATRNLATRKTRVNAMRSAYAGLQEEQARVAAQLNQRRAERDAIAVQLAAAPQFVETHKAITDDALWRSQAGEGKDGVDWAQLQKRSLVSQQLSPVYQDLALRSANLAAEVSALLPRAEQLAAEIEKLGVAVRELDEKYARDAAELEKLTLAREAELSRLQEDRNNVLRRLQRERQQDLDSIAREREARAAQLERDIAHEKELCGELAKAYNQAVLAKAPRRRRRIFPAAAVARRKRRSERCSAACSGFASRCGEMRAQWRGPERRDC